MPTYGVTIHKRETGGEKWENRYYVDADSAASAAALGLELAQLEQVIHGVGVNFYKIHSWLPGAASSEFYNMVVDFNGLFPTTAPIPLWVTAEVLFGVANSYPLYKRFRAAVGRTEIEGRVWSAAYQAALTTYAEGVDDKLLGYLRGRDGAVPNSININGLLTNTQLGKQWYNRS